MKKPTVSLTAFTWVFVPFALCLSAALLAAEATETLNHHRMIYAIWVALAFATPALCLFVFPRHRDGEYEQLFWTCAFAAYAVHFFYSFGLQYHFSLVELYAGQGVMIATSNMLFTAIWVLDIALAWWGPRAARWVYVERVIARALFLIEVVTASIVIFNGFVRVIGWTMVTALVVSVATRWLVRAQRPATRSAADLRMADSRRET